jgi:cell wall-associated NlpC family hydrolase
MRILPAIPVLARLTRSGALLAASLAALLTLLAIFATTVEAEPPSVAGKRAEVERIQADVARIDAELEGAAEAYNGAQYRLGQVQGRIDENTRVTTIAVRNLRTERAALARRLRHLYSRPTPSITEVLLTSDSLTSATDTIELLERAGEQDARTVSNIKEHRARLAEARIQLVADRETGKREVAEAARVKARVEGLLRERERVLNSAKGELGRLLEAARQAERRQAELAAQQARARTGASSPQAAPASPAGASNAPLPSGSGNSAVVGVAMQYLGVPYVWGGSSPAGFDCSGLISYSYGQVGKSVPHFTGAIWSAFPQVSRDQLQPGDVVFFRSDLGHAGIYIGGGQYVHAPHTGDVVRVASINERSDYAGAVRP